MSSVLIVGPRDDPQGSRVARAIRARGGRVARLDSRAFPERTRISFGDGDLSVGGRRLEQPVSVYVRSLLCDPLHPEFHDDLTTRPHGLIAQTDEKYALLTSVLLTLERRGARLVNGLEANAQHGRKPYQLELLRTRGLPVPRFLASNDPRAVRGFVRTVRKAVYKPLAGGATTRQIEKEDLTDDRLSGLGMAPVLFQELIEGVSVRAYVAGRRVVAAAEILSDELDYRRDERTVAPTRLSAGERRAVLRAARVCGMAFSGVDLIRSNCGFTIIECNPSPMFAVFEKKTGLDVAGSLADLLLAGRG